MFIVEGSVAKGNLWGLLEPIGELKTGNAHCDSFLGTTRRLNPNLPFTFYAPPVGGLSVSYDCDLTPYGPTLSKQLVGTLESINNKSRENPCDHSSLTGTLYPTSPSGKPVCWLSQWKYQAIANLYLAPGRSVNAYFGIPATYTSYKFKVFGRDGTRVESATLPSKWKVTYAPYISGWETTTAGSEEASLLAGNPLLDVPFYYCGYAFTGLVQYNPVTRMRHRMVHTSQNSWKEEFWSETHCNASYYAFDMRPPNDGVFSTDGYTVAYAHHTLTHRMRFIQTVSNGDYRALVETTIRVEYGGWVNQLPRAVPYTGVRTATSSGWYQVITLEPGLVAGLDCDVAAANSYCSESKSFSSLIYENASARSARTAAVTDVAGLESNWIENMSQASGTLDVINPLIEGYRAYLSGSPKAAVQALASAYLAYKYAVAPGIADYRDLKDNGKIVLKQVKAASLSERRYGRYSTKMYSRSSSPVDQVYRCCLILEVKDNPFSKLWSGLEKLGIDPTAQRVWDLVPFSFVADWFVSIGPTLERISAYQNLVMSRDVSSRISSYRVQWSLLDMDEEFKVTPPGFVRVGSPFSYVYYNRQVSSGRVGSIDPIIGPDSNGLTHSQWLQGAALVTLYKK